MGMPNIELCGNKHAAVEGCRGILEYAENSVRLKTGSLILSFKGQGLRIKFLGDNTIEIAGLISELSFIM